MLTLNDLFCAGAHCVVLFDMNVIKNVPEKAFANAKIVSLLSRIASSGCKVLLTHIHIAYTHNCGAMCDVGIFSD